MASRDHRRPAPDPAAERTPESEEPPPEATAEQAHQRSDCVRAGSRRSALGRQGSTAAPPSTGPSEGKPTVGSGKGSKQVQGGEPVGHKREVDKDAQDRLYVYSPCEHGKGYHVIRHRQDRLELGQIRELRQGRPAHGELVRLTPVENHERLFDVDVMWEGPKARGGDGPPMVSSDDYRQGWEAIFGRKRQGSGRSELN